jgi:hypothetical protein
LPSTRFRHASLLVLAGFFLAWAARPCQADELVLRNLKVIRNCQITAVDIDGIRVDREIEGVISPISWDLVLRASLANEDAEKSASIKEFSQSIGVPLARLKTRFLANDRLGLLEPAEALHAAVKGRSTQDNLLALIGLMRGQIAAGKREHAVPFAIEAIRLHSTAKIPFSVVPGTPPAVDSLTGLFEELPAIWIDSDAAKEVWPGVEKQLNEFSTAGTADKGLNAVWLYGASLAIAAGETKKTEPLLAKVAGEANWAGNLIQSEIYLASDRAEQAAATLLTAAPQVPQASRCWLALVQAKARAKLMKPSEDNSALILELLNGPAFHALDQPELAAGCLEQAVALATRAEDSKMAQALKSELQRAFPQTVAARRVTK